jgi:hypothetical protein
MQISFTKMHGLGNDFMVVRWPAGVPLPGTERVRAWADRRTGVGFDQLLVVATEAPRDADAAYRIFNADGGEVEQCGNGARCIARFVAPEPGRALVLTSPSGRLEAEILDAGFVRVSYGEPDFRPRALPFEAEGAQDRYRLMRLAGDVPVKRGFGPSGIEAIARCREILSQRVSVMIFPEGTRSPTADLLPFRDGAFRLAIDAGVPILPLALHGTADALPKHDWRFGWSTAVVEVLQPVETAGLTPADVPALKERVRNTIIEARDRLALQLA